MHASLKGTRLTTWNTTFKLFKQFIQTTETINHQAYINKYIKIFFVKDQKFNLKKR